MVQTHTDHQINKIGHEKIAPMPYNSQVTNYPKQRNNIKISKSEKSSHTQNQTHQNNSRFFKEDSECHNGFD